MSVIARPPQPLGRPARGLVASALALASIFMVAGSAFAAPSEGDGPALLPAQGPGGHGGGGGGGASKRGFDISYPQCGSAYPTNPAFAIVGVNGGLVFKPNPCLADEIAWGGGAAAELYANTANPGPYVSSFWPLGQTSPRLCDPSNPDSADCAYDYGWNAAADSFATATLAYADLGLAGSPAGTTWWLDVETTNSWRSDTTLNVAALQGATAYLLDVAGVSRLGFYSTTYQWGVITGGTTDFADHPSWGAGARSERVARNLCTSTPGFTGGRLEMVQYPWSGFDADLRC